MFALALLLTMVTAEAPGLPERLGDFSRTEVEELAVPHGDRELFEEYRCRAAYRAGYEDSQGRRMTVDAFRFLDAEGAHAAYLCSRPAGGVSPMIWQIPAVTGGGVTVMEYRNYVLRFRGALPSISSTMGEMLAALPGLSADEPPWNVHARYLDELSTRLILGPVSLRRFAGRIPPSVAAFRMGAKGRLARFETPAGAMTVVVFEYPTEVVARERAKALAALPGAVVRVDRACVGLTFDPIDPVTAEELLSGYFGAPVAMAWDPNTTWHGPMTLSEGLAVVAWGFIMGTVIAVVRRVSSKRTDPFPDRSISLKL